MGWWPVFVPCVFTCTSDVFWGERWWFRSGGTGDKAHQGLLCLLLKRHKALKVRNRLSSSADTPFTRQTAWHTDGGSRICVPSFSVRRRDLNGLICHQRVSTQCGVIKQSLIRIKRQPVLISVKLFLPLLPFLSAIFDHFSFQLAVAQWTENLCQTCPTPRLNTEFEKGCETKTVKPGLFSMYSCQTPVDSCNSGRKGCECVVQDWWGSVQRCVMLTFTAAVITTWALPILFLFYSVSVYSKHPKNHGLSVAFWFFQKGVG